MKTNTTSIAVLALLFSCEVSAVRLRDIFDAYDVESKKELLQTDDNIDPATLTAEIGGDQIAKDVKSATAGVADNAMVQLNDPVLQYDMQSETFSIAQQLTNGLAQGVPVHVERRIIDKDKDGVEDNRDITAEQRDRFYLPNVYSAPVEDLHNTNHGRLPGSMRWGEHPPPEVSKEKYMEEREKREAAADKKQQASQNEADKEELPALAQSDYQDLEKIEATDPADYDLVQTHSKGKFRPPQQFIQIVKPDDNNADTDVLENSIPDRSESEYDGEYVQLRLAEYVGRIGGPEDLEGITLADDDLSQLKWERGNNEIYDADGDGVEDNVSDGWQSWKFDQFYDPAVFHVVEDINNTHHGNLPGMKQKEWDQMQTEPIDTYSVIEDHDWVRW